jgi:hypothetical protein
VARKPQKTELACLRCDKPLYSFGVQEFRTGGTSGGWQLLAGMWAELDEDVVGFEVLACKGCGKVELRIPDEG